MSLKHAGEARDLRMLQRSYPTLIKASVWGSILGTVFILRSFFLLIFLTFVFAYVQTLGVDWLKRYVSARRLRVTVIGLAFLFAVGGIISFIIPKVRTEAAVFARNYQEYIKRIDHELVLLSQQYPMVVELVPGLADADFSEQNWKFKNSPTAKLFQQLTHTEPDDSDGKSGSVVLESIKNIGGYLVSVASSFLLALLFSFLIVLDLEKLRESIASLHNTRLRFAYDLVKDDIVMFGRVMGRALTAQALIGCINTILTALLIYYFGLGSKLTFLSSIVFFCSFIPVAGVFLSSVPICLLVMQEMGFHGALLAGLMIWIIHLIEAYILNPRIFGRTLHINPVLVLIILTVAGKLFGVWGLVLGLPICTYIFGYAIRKGHGPSWPVADVSA